MLSRASHLLVSSNKQPDNRAITKKAGFHEAGFGIF